MKVLTMERCHRGWSKAELARRAAMSPSDVGKIEAGRVMPYPTQLRKLADALGWRTADADRLLAEVEPIQAGAAG